MHTEGWLETNRQIFKNWLSQYNPSNMPVEIQHGAVSGASSVQWRIYNMRAWTPRELAIVKYALRKHLSPDFSRCILVGKTCEEGSPSRFYSFFEDDYPDCMDYSLEMDIQSLIKEMFD